MQTQGSKTFQYLVENRPIGISLVAASEKERAQTEPSLATARGCKTIIPLPTFNVILSNHLR